MIIAIIMLRLNSVAPERIWKGGEGHRSGAKHGKKILVVPLHFLALQAQLSFWWALSWW